MFPAAALREVDFLAASQRLLLRTLFPVFVKRPGYDRFLTEAGLCEQMVEPCLLSRTPLICGPSGLWDSDSCLFPMRHQFDQEALAEGFGAKSQAVIPVWLATSPFLGQDVLGSCPGWVAFQSRSSAWQELDKRFNESVEFKGKRGNQQVESVWFWFPILAQKENPARSGRAFFFQPGQFRRPLTFQGQNPLEGSTKPDRDRGRFT